MAAQFLFPDLNQIIADNSETARYLGYKKDCPPDQKIYELIDDCAAQMHKVLMPKAVFEIYDLMIEDCLTESDTQKKRLKFADVVLETADLGRNLQDCSKVALCASTIGPQVDALIRRTQIIDPVKASIFQATGAMYIEKVVDILNDRIKNEAQAAGGKTKPRYSPGYGDVPLTMQKEFFRLLPCTKIGLTLMDTLIMAPEKSVTAFVGIREE